MWGSIENFLCSQSNISIKIYAQKQKKIDIQRFSEFKESFCEFIAA